MSSSKSVVMFACATLLATTFSFLACGRAGPDASDDTKAASADKDPAPTKESSEQSPAVGGDVTADSKTTGTITGVVHYKGAKPTIKPLVVPKDHRDSKTCGMEIPYERHVLGPKNELANAVVSLSSDKLPKGKPRTIQIDNVKCRFVPHVQAATVRSELLVTSKDAVLHTAMGFMPGTSWGMNIAIPNPKSTVKKRLGPKEGWILFNCSTHAWMRAHVKVFKHDFYAVTGPDGRFKLSGVPPGDYTLEIWHETNPLGAQKAKVSVKASENTPVSLTLEAKT